MSVPASAAFAIILAGGGGTRLWPASRRARPKQLLRLGGPESLLASTIRRACALAGAERTLVVTAADQEEQLRRDLPSLPPENVIAEPGPRNTAAAIGLGAAVACRREGAGSVLAVLPADHHIADEAGFVATARIALAEGRRTITTIGIRPAHPETGFGYIRLGARVPAAEATTSLPLVYQVASFVEKPDRATAERYVSSGEYLWNAGMFFLTAGRMLDEARRHIPPLGQALDAFVAAPDFEARVRELYPALPAVSIDNGIMERATGLRVVPGDFGWSDIGSWAGLSEIRAVDQRGNVVVGQGAAVIDSDGCVVMAEEDDGPVGGDGDGGGHVGDGDGGGQRRRLPFIGVLGARDLVVVVTADAVLVIPKDRAQDVRQLVEAAKKSGRSDLL
jgi:mannose-1-phosphate guanylyltransferase